MLKSRRFPRCASNGFRPGLFALIPFIIAAALAPVVAADQGSRQAVKPRLASAPPAAEDILPLPGTPWVIASGVSIGEDAVPGLYLLSQDPPHLEKLTLSGAEEGPCPDAPPGAGFSPLGLSLGVEGADTLYAINRGTRRAIEIFDLSPDATGKPELAWRSCVAIPEGVFANSVAPHPDGSLLLSNTYDPRDKQSWQKQQQQQVTGEVLQWRKDSGWQGVDGTALSGPNGLVVSADGCYGVVAAWAESRLLRFSLPCGSGETMPPQSLALPFLPDNLRWTDQGSLLATGQITTPDGLLQCVEKDIGCPAQVKVSEIDPLTMTLRREWTVGGTDLQSQW